MMAMLTDSKSAISILRKLDQGLASEVEARNSAGEKTKVPRVVWVKGHKGIKGNEEDDKLCREASILGHEHGQEGEKKRERWKKQKLICSKFSLVMFTNFFTRSRRYQL